jgi:hypothetical protein
MMKRLWIALGMSLGLAVLMMVTTHAAAAEGRWKMGPQGCYFDPNDDGPNQCTRGRWRADGYGGCYFDAFDSGPDQCSPYSSLKRSDLPVERWALADTMRGLWAESVQRQAAAAHPIQNAGARKVYTPGLVLQG